MNSKVEYRLVCLKAQNTVGIGRENMTLTHKTMKDCSDQPIKPLNGRVCEAYFKLSLVNGLAQLCH